MRNISKTATNTAKGCFFFSREKQLINYGLKTSKTKELQNNVAKLPETFVGTLTASAAPLNVGLRDVIDTFAINNIGWGGGVKEHHRPWSGELPQVITSGSVVSITTLFTLHL